MYLVQSWFNLSDAMVEDAIYDSYAIRSFMGLNFHDEQAPDATTLLKFRRLLKEQELGKKMFEAINQLLESKRCLMRGGTIVDATIIQAAGICDLLVTCVFVAPAQVLPDRPAEELVLLKHHRHLTAQRVHVIIPHVHTADLDAALRRIVQSGDCLLYTSDAADEL